MNTETKKEFQGVIKAIREGTGPSYQRDKRNKFPKAMMTGNQMRKHMATVNCGGEWLKGDPLNREIAEHVLTHPVFCDFLKAHDATAEIEDNPFGGVQIRIRFR